MLPRHPLFLHSDQSVQGRLQWPLLCMQAEEIPAASAGKFQLAEETKEDPTDTLSFFPHLWFPHDSSCTGSVGATCKIKPLMCLSRSCGQAHTILHTLAASSVTSPFSYFSLTFLATKTHTVTFYLGLKFQRNMGQNFSWGILFIFFYLLTVAQQTWDPVSESQVCCSQKTPGPPAGQG